MPGRVGDWCQDGLQRREGGGVLWCIVDGGGAGEESEFPAVEGAGRGDDVGASGDLDFADAFEFDGCMGARRVERVEDGACRGVESCAGAVHEFGLAGEGSALGVEGHAAPDAVRVQSFELEGLEGRVGLGGWRRIRWRGRVRRGVPGARPWRRVRLDLDGDGAVVDEDAEVDEECGLDVPSDLAWWDVGVGEDPDVEDLARGADVDPGLAHAGDRAQERLCPIGGDAGSGSGAVA